MSGSAAERNGNESQLAANAPSDVYPCRGDGPNDYCFIYTSRAGNRHWERLLSVIGRADLVGDERFVDATTRYRNREAVADLLSAWTRTRTKTEVMECLGKAGVPAGAVFDTMELSTDAYLRSRGTFVAVQHPERGKFVMPGWPVHMSGSSVTVVAAPLLGEHTEEVYADWLGLTHEEVERLRQEAVV
jgi:formyl-CoA transferase